MKSHVLKWFLFLICRKKVKAVISSFDVTTVDRKAIDEFPLHIYHLWHDLSVKIAIRVWVMFYIGSTHHISVFWQSWSTLTRTQDWLSSPVLNMLCFQGVFHLGFFSSQANISDILFITLSVLFDSREKGAAKMKYSRNLSYLKAFTFSCLLVTWESLLSKSASGGKKILPWWFYAPKQIKVF